METHPFSWDREWISDWATFMAKRQAEILAITPQNSYAYDDASISPDEADYGLSDFLTDDDSQVEDEFDTFEQELIARLDRRWRAKARAKHGRPYRRHIRWNR